jgi:lipid A ethanolaminephosphotransferase
MMRFRPHLTTLQLVFAFALFIVAAGNQAFFRNLLDVYPPDAGNTPFLLSAAVILVCANVVMFSLLCYRYTVKPVLILMLLVSASSAYFMDSYNVIIDDAMLDNIIKTDVAEATDLLNMGQLGYFFFIGLVPALLLAWVRIKRQSFRRAALARIGTVIGALVISAGLILAQGDHFASFVREHKPLRYYANPLTLFNAVAKYAGTHLEQSQAPLTPIGNDAAIPETDADRELIIFVVGETARADHFALNGYTRNTNPRMQQEDVISFANVASCGTSTAHSLPCMFSVYPRDDFSKSKAGSTENLLDVLQKVGVNVIWLDNNSSSKGVADRVPYLNYKSPENNPVCDIECRDEGMLENLRNYIASHPSGDIFIVLHQMGNHGPAYYKRYPPEFEVFTPTCKTNQLEQCTAEEINNTYDNALLYTDHFLGLTIDLLKDYPAFEAAMIYVSDHGESLGENNIYLHGLPYLFAPRAQTHVPMIVWFNEHYAHEIDVAALRDASEREISHDNLFHTVLGLLEIQTAVYDPQLDIVRHLPE